MSLNHFARIDRLDVLRELLVADACSTTCVVLDEIRKGVPDHPILRAALELDWLEVARFESLPELNCFAKWVDGIGAGARDLGEAGVFAVAELRRATAVTDDQSATRVARKYGVDVHGTVWLLCRARKNGKSTVTAAGNLVEMLRATGMRLPCTGPEFATWLRSRGLL
jgi:predicted nucleic acid-binding protein